MQYRKNYSSIFGLWLILFSIFGGAYKTPVGIISISYISFVWGVGLILVYFAQNQFYRVEQLIGFTKKYYIYLFLMIVLFLVSIIQFSFAGVGDTLFIDLQFKRVIQAAISFVFFAITVDYIASRLSPEQLFFGLMLFLFSVLLLSLFQMANDPFRMWYLDLTATDGYWYEWAKKSNRAIGLKAMSIWDTSVSYALLIFIGFSTYFQGIRKKTIFWLYIFIALLFLLVIISGRTGLFFLVAFFGLLSVNYKRYGLLITFAILAVVSILMVLTFANSELILRVINFAFELVVNLFQGKIETSSTDDLLNNHLFIPNINNPIFGDNFFIGDGDEVTSQIGRSSDSAFVINYVSYGFLGIVATVVLSILTGRIFFDYFGLNRKNYFYYLVLFVCLALAFGLYLKILIYVSATLLKAMIFMTICLKHIDIKKEIEFGEYNEK